jgi:hypothetical protein
MTPRYIWRYEQHNQEHDGSMEIWKSEEYDGIGMDSILETKTTQK